MITGALIIARCIFSVAGYVNSEPEGLGDLAIALFGASAVTFAPASQVADFALQFDPFCLLVREDLEDQQMTMALARAIARWWQHMHPFSRLSDAEEEELAISLALPFEAFRAAAKRCSYDAAALANEFVCPVYVVRRRLRRLDPQSGTYVRIRTAAS
jgi:hypothetical protein